MLERVRTLPGVPLDRKAYHEHMRVETERVNGPVWKLERSQFFAESPDDPAWAAFTAGDWDKSLEIFESERSGIEAEAGKFARQGSQLRRLRITESPVSAYLQWELQSLRIVNESGSPVRVLDAGSVRHLEADGPLPELVIVGHEVLYEVQYDSEWAACGARRITDREAIESAAEELAALWTAAEPLPSYFDREITPLPAPSTG